ncbi:MAG: FAD-binding oxidoreductase, partial [Pseudomonadales bacterium]
MAIVDEIAQLIGDKYVLQGEDAAQKNMEWGEHSSCQALAFVKPANTAELAAILKLCNASKQPVNIVAGLTNLVRATVCQPNEIALSVERLDAIEHIDTTEMTMTAGAGVLLQLAHDAASEAGLLFPWDIGARGSCMLGGNLATNAGGTKVIRYGMARQSVLGLEVVLADGTVLSSLNRYLKNNSGVDLKQLFIGSEGLYGVITKAVIALQPKTSSCNVAFI